MTLDLSSLHLSHFWQQAFPLGLKVLFSILCGGLIGLEREFKNKPAGLKTNILICLGATLYTIVSELIPESMAEFNGPAFKGDPGRVAAQIVSGVGFLGAGVIMQSQASVFGITTAATIWVVAAIGVCIGAGYPIVALVFTMTVLFTLLIINSLEGKIFGNAGGHVIEIVYDDKDGAVRGEINHAIEKNHIELDDFDISQTAGHYILRLHYQKTVVMHKRLILDLWAIKGIHEVRQL